MSTTGTSMPSLKRSTENTTLTRPSARSTSAPRRSSSGLSPQTATAAMPASLKTRAMKRACSTLTQKPSARMRARVIDAREDLGDHLRAQASLAV